MNRVVACLLGLTLGIASVAGVATAQDSGSPATVVDLPDIDRGSGQDGREVARGDDGDSITYTIVESPDSNAGDATTAVAPTTPAAPDLSRVPVSVDSSETTVAPPTGEPASAPVAESPEAGIAGDATTMAPADQGAPPAVSCLDFGSWYDAQVYYESAGGLTAVPELVSALDADLDGVACEELIVYS